MARSTGEMPFLDHLEELRTRILRSLGALVVGFGAGFWLVQRFQVVNFLQRPIAPYLQGGRLTVLSPTDPVMITFKLAFVAGLVLASPVLIWQLWAFLSPALYERERKALVPSLFAGLVLFLLGCAFAWIFVVPKAVAVLLSFQAGAFNNMFTYDAWFSFVLQILLAMGISAELPLLLIILTALGITTPASLNKFRRVAIVLCFIAGAVLSPGTDIVSCLMMTVPLVLLYEVGIAGSVIVHRRRLKAAAGAVAVLLALGALPARAEAQIPGTRQQAVPGDTTRMRKAGRMDTASARRLGLPSAPSRQFPVADTVMQALMTLDGYYKTRYVADTANLNNADRAVRLGGNAMTERDARILEAAHIEYREKGCDLVAQGDPHMFENSQVLVGNKVRYDTCIQRGVIDEALTTFDNGGMGNWFIRGNLGVDSSSVRVFAANSQITSCDLPIPDYHFSAKEVKWTSRSLLVARPTVLYVRDVPVAWIPFIFQETKPGRRSGILVPQFGFNDIVRPDASYNRQVTNAGYYWAPNEYFDVAGRFDWYANRYTRWTISAQYNILDRFFRGALDYGRQNESTGSVSQFIRWNHQQTFGITTTLAVNLDLATNSNVIARNAIDPLLSTQQLSSAINFTKRYSWGSMTLGGNRRQTLGTDQLSMLLPSLTINPKPVDISQKITWSPTMSFTNQMDADAKSYLLFPEAGGGVDSVEQTPSRRLSTLSIGTPFRMGTFTWQNSLVLTDRFDKKVTGLITKIPNDNTPDPTDSVVVNQTLASSFETDINWDTGINLPLLFRSSWKVTPTVGVRNKTSGPFAVRNEKTDGQFILQGKRFAFGLAAAPTVFGRFGGIGPIAAIRHTFSPLISWSYSPEATVPEDFARATQVSPGQPLNLKSPATQILQISMSNNFEAKERKAAGDTNSTTEARKFRLLSIATSGVAYDFEQAKLPGKRGWATQALTNSFLSDLVPGFNLAITHNLWDREVSSDSAKFSPFLQSVSASFGLSSHTFRAIGALFGLNAPPSRTGLQGQAPGPGPPTSVVGSGGVQQRTLYATNQLAGSRRPFSANINLTISRTRANELLQQPASSNSTLAFSTSFSPTKFWGVSWQTMYNITKHNFDGQVIRLERDLHDWRAGFNFVKNPNGNFAMYFTIHLVDLPDLKLDYNQTTIH